jgi:hypothetical protein
VESIHQYQIEVKMELTDTEARAVKAIYSDYHSGATSADEALHALEQLINGNEE